MRHRLHGFVMAAAAVFPFAFTSTPAFAATVVCSGSVAYLGFHANSTVMLRLGSMNTPVLVCSFEDDWNVEPGYTTGPATCRAIYGTLLAAKLAGATVNDVYFDGPAVASTCNSWQPWTAANIRHYNLQ